MERGSLLEYEASWESSCWRKDFAEKQERCDWREQRMEGGIPACYIWNGHPPIGGLGKCR